MSYLCHFLTVFFLFFGRKRMTIDDSLEHPWIKVGFLYCIYISSCAITVTLLLRFNCLLHQLSASLILSLSEKSH